ncbi:MAG: polysaccharide deacetylase family protein [Clostridium sp.]|nr:polysaccharide deacetylase family protein [Clostridium sp.]
MSRDGIALRSSRKKRNTRRILVIVLSFMFLFSIGFAVGNKFLNKSDKSASDKKLEDNKTLQGNKDKVEDTNKNTTNVDSKTNEPNATNKDNNTSTAPNKSTTDATNKPADKPGDNTKPDPTKKEVFLTFDDGPTKNITPRVLKVLDDYNVKATFFVIGKNAERYPDLIKEEAAKGHMIANHTYSHEYNQIYSSSANFLKEFEKTNQVLTSILGNFDNKVIRFPGGSYGKKRAPFKAVAKNAGYTYVDWNALSGDAERLNVPAATLIENVKKSVGKQHQVVILMHDAATKATTADSLPKVIEYLKSQGYEFKTLKDYKSAK